jgi:hypothetical protein
VRGATRDTSGSSWGASPTRCCTTPPAPSRSSPSRRERDGRLPRGSIHEGGELGHSLSHAYGTALDDPDLPVALRQRMTDVRTRHQAWIREHGSDLPEAADWTWNS